MHLKEVPYLLWFRKKELHEALWVSYRLKERGNEEALSQDHLTKMAALFRQFLKKLEYLSYLDQDEEQTPIGKLKEEKHALSLDQLEKLKEAYLQAHPQKKAKDVTMDEFFFWYKVNVRAGRSPLTVAAVKPMNN